MKKIMLIRQWLLVVVIFIGLLSLTTACGILDDTRVLYVSKSGKDSNSGSSSEPYLSPLVALDYAKKLRADGFKGKIELVVEEGLYRLENAMLIDPTLSGTEKQPFVIRSSDKGNVTFSGSVSPKLQWLKQDDGIWTTSVPQGLTFDQLYADGKQLIRARYPNYDANILPFNGYAENAISPERVKRWSDPVGGYVHSLHIGRWGGFHHQIVGKGSNGEVKLEGGYQNNRPSDMHKSFRYVENIFEELDVANEWYLDNTTHTLYYLPEDGVDPNDQEIEAPVLENILTLQGDVTSPVHDVRIEGIRFVHTKPTFMKTAEPLLRSDWTIYRQGAVKIEGAERCQVVNSDFVDLGGNAIFVSNYNREVVLSGNLIERVGAGGINFVGSADAVRSPSFRYEEFVPAQELDTSIGPQSEDYPMHCEASDNLIRDIGLIEKQVAGVQIAMASSIRVLHNTIYRVPRSGINIGDGTWGGHDLAFNDVFHTVLETSDHGAFNSWGRDRFWQPNREEMDRLVADNPSWIMLDAIKTTTIRNNRFQCDHGWDIDLDDGSTNYRIFNNICLTGGLKLREGFYRNVYNNIMINNGFHPHVWFENSHDVFRNNVLMQEHKDIQVKFWGDTVDYNFYTNQSDLLKDQLKGVEKHGVVFTPKFINSGIGDFRLENANEIGFENFDMLSMGVTTARLISMADKPDIPAIIDQGETKAGEVFSWKGGDFKSIETLGEQSAAGLPTMEGVLVLKLDKHALLAKSELTDGDVIVGCEGEEVKNLYDFQRVIKANLFKSQLSITIFRNQIKQRLLILL